MSSLHQRVLRYTTTPSAQLLRSLLASISHARNALSKEEASNSSVFTTSDDDDLRHACETLATCFHTPPFERVQLLLWSAPMLPSTAGAATGHEDEEDDTTLRTSISNSDSGYIRACRTRLEFARFWLEVLKEEMYQSGNGVNERVKWLEYDLNLARERLNEMTVEVMVEEWKQRVFEGCHVNGNQQGEESKEGRLMMQDDDFAERMFEHPIFSLEWAMWRDRQDSELKEGA